MADFSVDVTSGFRRMIKVLARQHVPVIREYEQAIGILAHDPYNLSRQHKIKKLTDVPFGRGQWRIRVDKYRVRYDITGKTVILKSIRHRRDSYSGKDS